MKRPAKPSQTKLMRIYRAVVDGADTDRVHAIVAGLPDGAGGLTVADSIILAGQIVGNALAGMPQAQQTDLLQGLFMAIHDVIDQRAMMATASKLQH